MTAAWQTIGGPIWQDLRVGDIVKRKRPGAWARGTVTDIVDWYEGSSKHVRVTWVSRPKWPELLASDCLVLIERQPVERLSQHAPNPVQSDAGYVLVVEAS